MIDPRVMAAEKAASHDISHPSRSTAVIPDELRALSGVAVSHGPSIENSKGRSIVERRQGASGQLHVTSDEGRQLPLSETHLNL